MAVRAIQILLLLTAWHRALLADEENPMVQVQQGKLRGVRQETVWGKEYLAFYGIPFAKPPVGSLRFKAPQPPEPWTEVYDATMERNECSQNHVVTKMHTGSEDCLFLNVYTHKLADNTSSPRAVMVWIHGGAFKLGSGGAMMQGPDYLMEEDVVVVTLQYRLGVFGFINLPAAGVSGNIGMKDQVMGLKWVQNNIASFGGDSTRVTIFGESAGGASVHYHLLSPMSEGLFHGAIMQSGSALDPWAFKEPEEIRKATFELGNSFGCNQTGDTELYDCLMKQSEEKLVGVLSFEMNFAPTIESASKNDEDTFLEERPWEIMNAGKSHNVRTIMGTNKYEAALFMSKVPVPSEDKLDEYIAHQLEKYQGSKSQDYKDELCRKIKTTYYGNNTVTNGTIDMLTDVMFLYGTDKTAKLHAAKKSEPVHYYMFTYDGKLAFHKLLHLHISRSPTHADELGNLFHTFFTPDLDKESSDVMMSRKLVRMWANFAKDSDPTPTEDSLLNIKWPPYTTSDEVYLDMGKELELKRGLRKERMALCEEVLGHTRKSKV